MQDSWLVISVKWSVYQAKRLKWGTCSLLADRWKFLFTFRHISSVTWIAIALSSTGLGLITTSPWQQWPILSDLFVLHSGALERKGNFDLYCWLSKNICISGKEVKMGNLLPIPFSCHTHAHPRRVVTSCITTKMPSKREQGPLFKFHDTSSKQFGVFPFTSLCCLILCTGWTYGIWNSNPSWKVDKTNLLVQAIGSHEF